LSSSENADKNSVLDEYFMPKILSMAKFHVEAVGLLNKLCSSKTINASPEPSMDHVKKQIEHTVKGMRTEHNDEIKDIRRQQDMDI
jgi:hypothetical protein